MKRFIMCALLLILALLAGARFIDIVRYTSAVTGFVTVGPLWIRYVLLGIGAVVCFVPLLFSNKSFSSSSVSKNGFTIAFIFGVLCEVYGVFCVVYSIFMHSGLFKLCSGFLYIALGAWCFYAAFYTAKANAPSPRGAWFAILGGLSLYVTVLERFLTQPSSLHRLWPILDILSVLAALLFFSAVFKTVYSAGNLPFKRLTCFGLLAFYFCTCLQMPGAVYLFTINKLSFNDLLLAIILSVVGLAGAAISQEVVNDSDKNT